MPSSYEKIKQYVEEEIRKKENGYPEETLVNPFTIPFATMSESHAKHIRRLEESIHELELASGKDIKQLTRMFLSGWTLNPPRELTPSFREFLDSL